VSQAFIIPFVNQTLSLLAAVAQLRCAPNTRVVLVQDHAGDGSRGQQDLDDDEVLTPRRANDPVTLLRNSEHLGYVGSVNRAARWILETNAECDFVWVVNDDVAFVRGLPESGDVPRDAGLIGVLSNRAGYQSIAYSLDESGDYLYPNRDVGTLVAQYDALLARAGPRLMPVPLVHGFCFGIGRACLEQTGLLDDEHFDLGYGSDYDLSLRATRAGFVNFVHAGAFVWHIGAASAGRVKRRVLATRADYELCRRYGDDYKRAKFVTRERLNRHMANFTHLSRG
jgi:GT2 family glycosyltransferase